MDSLNERIGEIIDELRRPGTTPGREVLEQSREDLGQLDDLVRAVPDDGDRYELDLRSREARALWDNAWAEVEHPMIHSPQPLTPQRSALADYRGALVWDRDVLDGFER